MKSSLICLALFAVFASSVQGVVYWFYPPFLKIYDNVVNECTAKSMNTPQCYFSCVWIKFGLIDAKGKLDSKAAKDFIRLTKPGDLDQQILGDKVIEACEKAKVDGNPCLATNQYVVCMRKKAIETGFDSTFF